MAKNYWIMKSEPNEFGIDDLALKQEAFWDGVRNYQVRNMFRDVMRVGDKALFYHSNAAVIGVVGEMKIVKANVVDPTQFVPKHKYYDAKALPENPRWLGVVVGFTKKFKRSVTLQEIKAEPLLANLPFVKKGNRLSVIPITKSEYEIIINMAKGK